MEPRDCAAETQSQAAAGFIALLAAKESLEDEWQIRRSDPRSAVRDFHYRPPVAVLQGYRDLSVFGRELEGVVEQINQQAPDVALVPVDHHVAVDAGRKRKMLCLYQRFNRLRDLMDQDAQIERSARDRRFLLQARKRQQFIRHAASLHHSAQR